LNGADLDMDFDLNEMSTEDSREMQGVPGQDFAEQIKMLFAMFKSLFSFFEMLDEKEILVDR
jgi:hypothetical protein